MSAATRRKLSAAAKLRHAGTAGGGGGTAGNTGSSQNLGRTVSTILPSLVTAIRALTNDQLQKQLETFWPADNNTIGGQADRHALVLFAQRVNEYMGSRTMSAGGGIHNS